ncbi:hypothetical protein BGW36DRAFT_444636 [Talaromyces proteolyticus]|uniref:Uncharacterized protein n=1 Tax=Talaromyces proteolyticus TaxID=1131652 RepID=A0AAD4KYV4_9EURO|nr:uncharacterized protein BGW36DRAFT_444636 [Talaromyces proteolyticus]KAH8704065.1 hypothetical protein BGW36DRAFT_444636 [Talaromyces proteolyticus]
MLCDSLLRCDESRIQRPSLLATYAALPNHETTHMAVPSTVLVGMGSTTSNLLPVRAESPRGLNRHEYRDNDHNNDSDADSRTTTTSITSAVPTTSPDSDPSNQYILSPSVNGGQKAGLIVGLTVGCILTICLFLLLGVRRKYGPDYRSWPILSTRSGRRRDISSSRNEFHDEMESIKPGFVNDNRGHHDSWFREESFDYEGRGNTARMNGQTGSLPKLARLTGEPNIVERQALISQPALKENAATRPARGPDSSYYGTTTLILESEELLRPVSDTLPVQTPDLISPRTVLPPLPQEEPPRQRHSKQTTRIHRKSHLSWSSTNTSAENNPTAAISAPQTSGASSPVTIPSYYIPFYHQFISPPVSPSAEPARETLSSRDSELSQYKSIGSWAHYQSQRRQQQQQNQTYQHQRQKREKKSFIDSIDELAITSPISPTSPMQSELVPGSQKKYMYSEKHKHSSLTSVETLLVFRQHPGTEVDFGPASRKGRIRSSLLSRLMRE